MQLGSMFVSNCNNTLHISDALCFHPRGALKNCTNSLYTIWLSAEAIDLGRPYWILHPVSCHTPEAATTAFKCSWRWTQKASETCRALLQLLINILPSCITLDLYIYSLIVYLYFFTKWNKCSTVFSHPRLPNLTNPLTEYTGLHSHTKITVKYILIQDSQKWAFLPPTPPAFPSCFHKDNIFIISIVRALHFTKLHETSNSNNTGRSNLLSHCVRITHLYHQTAHFVTFPYFKHVLGYREECFVPSALNPQFTTILLLVIIIIIIVII